MGAVHKIAISGFAAAILAALTLVNSAAVEPAPAYGGAALRLDAAAAARHASRMFERADLSNDGALDLDEYQVLTIVAAELSLLNGFVAIYDLEGPPATIALPDARPLALAKSDKPLLRRRAAQEFWAFAGDDERLAQSEFVDAVLERFIASDGDRNGALTGGELGVFAQRQASLAFRSS
jgi:hypothetical protein